MRILGLHGGGHDSGAALIHEGRLVALAEERLTRVKNDGAFPHRSIAAVLEGAPLTAVDRVVMDVCDGTTAEAERALRAAGYSGPLRLVHHHLAHAAAAHFVAPDPTAAVLVVDAGGTRQAEWPTTAPLPASFPGGAFDQEVQSFFRARGRQLETLHQTFTRPGARLGIGWLWALVTMHLGFGPLDAGKTMGLAAHAPPATDVIPWVSPGGDLLFPMELEVANPTTWVRWHQALFGGLPPRAPGAPLEEAHAALAARLQRTTEAFLLRLAQQLRTATEATTLCFAGGVALNVLANRVLADRSGFAHVAVQPAAGDSGIALGCALLGAVEAGVKLPECPSVNVLGAPQPEGAFHAAEERCRAAGLRVSHPEDLPRRVAQRVAEGALIGLVDGASELGPRALGHRSLLADPRDVATQDRVNERVKHRERFRPFAPVVLEELAGEPFDLVFPSRNMLFSATVRPEWRARVPAITHVDGTARVQTVAADYPGLLRSILEAFHAVTGVPVLLNTSLNGPTEPIVESPDDAVRLLLGSGLDALVLGRAWIEKPAGTR